MTRRPATLFLSGVLIGALVGGAAGGVVGSLREVAVVNLGPGVEQSARPTATVVPEPVGTGGVVEVVREVGPSVVTVVQKNASGRAIASGSGFVIDAARGHIVTNSHVVSTQRGEVGAAFDVIFADDRTVAARLVGRDPETDVAVLQVDAQGLKAAALGNSDEVPVGATLVAIGSALGDFKNSVTTGVLSGKGRRFRSESDPNVFLEDLVQTDAAISPGNSGGPLIWAATKQIIGMNTLVVREPGSEGLGFAISSNTVRQIADELIRSGAVVRGKIGISYQLISARSAQSLGLPPGTSGVLLAQVLPGSPAAQAGLRPSDVVTKVNDAQIDFEHPLPTLMLKFRPGDRVRLAIIRDGRPQTVDVTLGR